MTMIDVRGIPTGQTGQALRARVEQQLTQVLARLPVQPTTALVAFHDDNGPKGGVATRCSMTVRRPRRAAIRVEEVATTPREAFAKTLATLIRTLNEDRAQFRDDRRHPKKYYVARQVLEGPGVTGRGVPGAEAQIEAPAPPVETPPRRRRAR